VEKRTRAIPGVESSSRSRTVAAVHDRRVTIRARPARRLECESSNVRATGGHPVLRRRIGIVLYDDPSPAVGSDLVAITTRETVSGADLSRDGKNDMVLAAPRMTRSVRISTSTSSSA
jgi:hypothetical protein